jgi:sugar lactone lactonase YvrE
MPYENRARARCDGRTVETMLTGVGLSNGLGWDPSGTVMYYIDSPTRRVGASGTGPHATPFGLR